MLQTQNQQVFACFGLETPAASHGHNILLQEPTGKDPHWGWLSGPCFAPCCWEAQAEMQEKREKRKKNAERGKEKKKFYFACCFGYLLHSTLQNAVKFILTVAMQFFFLESKEWHLGITTFFSLIMFHSEITDF